MSGFPAKTERPKIWHKLSRIIVSPGLEPAQQASRILAIERDLILPIKLLIIVTLVYFFFFANWLDKPNYMRDFVFELIRYGFIGYSVANLIVGTIFIRARQIALEPLQWTIYTMGLLDALLFASLTFVTEGFDSILFWLFPVLILRNAMSIPNAVPQIVVNLAVCFCYISAGIWDISARQDETKLLEYLSRSTREALSVGIADDPTEPFLMRILILLLWTFCCYGVQALAEKHRRTLEEAVEFATRQEQLQTAGRLAAEIAHRIKNPLSIIANSAFSLERSLRDGKDSQREQLAIIREEVDKADRILTELMGYAQLAEGRVEKLNVIEELDRAIKEVLPPAINYGVKVDKDYDHGLPPVMMQRSHLSEIFLNILQNARDAMTGKGKIKVSAKHGDNYALVITIEDTGPGIPPEKIERVFEAYFSTKEKGTGLGLAIARHNAEVYGGTLRAESELGKGARFILQFPVKMVMKFKK